MISHQQRKAIRQVVGLKVRAGAHRLAAARRAAELAEDEGADYGKALDVALPYANRIIEESPEELR